jgi:hypothetical protein
MNMVDDATSQSEARMGKEETLWAAVGVLRSWIEKYGVPQALYTDWKNVYIRAASSAEQLRGEVPGRAVRGHVSEVGHSHHRGQFAPGKGRVERNHGTHQDRLIKKMRRKGITSYAGSNEYLEHEYTAGHNRRFARAAGQAGGLSRA